LAIHGAYSSNLRADFHPAQRADDLSRPWLAEHQVDYSLVRPAG
jgi:hypothetical protein